MKVKHKIGQIINLGYLQQMAMMSGHFLNPSYNTGNIRKKTKLFLFETSAKHYGISFYYSLNKNVAPPQIFKGLFHHHQPHTKKLLDRLEFCRAAF